MSIDVTTFNQCIEQIMEISNTIGDHWELHEKEELENGKYLTKKISSQLTLNNKDIILIVFEYHLAYNISYVCPILCFIAWKQDGTLLDIDEYCQHNQQLDGSNILTTLTQLDHPVLCRPFLTLHPCRTEEIMQIFINKSKNPVISWLTTIAPYLNNLKIPDNYIQYC